MPILTSVLLRSVHDLKIPSGETLVTSKTGDEAVPRKWLVVSNPDYDSDKRDTGGHLPPQKRNWAVYIPKHKAASVPSSRASTKKAKTRTKNSTVDEDSEADHIGNTAPGKYRDNSCCDSLNNHIQLNSRDRF